MTQSRGLTRVCSLRTPAWSLAISVLVTSPLAAQVCLGSTEESSGWIAAEYGRAAESANVMGVDAGWQLSRTLAVFADGRITAYPRPDPQRDRLALGVAYTMKRTRRFGVCLTPGIEGERIGDPGLDGADGLFNVRSGVVTVGLGSPATQRVDFSTDLADLNYSVALLTNGTTGTAIVTFGCMWHVDSQDLAGFTFSCRDATAGGTYYNLVSGAVIAYIAIPYR